MSFKNEGDRGAEGQEDRGKKLSKFHFLMDVIYE
jgi:hypothetical protein